MNKKIASEFAIGIIVLIAIFFGVIFWFQGKEMTSVSGINIQQMQSSKNNSCKVEYKVCEDGSFVSREGQNCEFSPCPETSSLKAHGCVASMEQYWCEEMQKCVDASHDKCYTPYDADWKVYKNKKYGFEFKYPKTYQVTEMGTERINKLSSNEVEMESFHISSLNENVGFIVRIYVSLDPKMFSGPDDREYTGEKTVNGVKFTRFHDPGMGDNIGYHAKYGKFYYEINSSFDSGQLDEILSTFKFME